MNQHDYISLRIINASLREDVGGLVSTGTFINDEGQQWLVYQGPTNRLRLAVSTSDYMQPWVTIQPHWQIDIDGSWVQDQGYANWLAALMPDQKDETRQLFAAYEEEADTAVAQGELCAAAFDQQRAFLITLTIQRHVLSLVLVNAIYASMPPSSASRFTYAGWRYRTTS